MFKQKELYQLEKINDYFNIRKQIDKALEEVEELKSELMVYKEASALNDLGDMRLAFERVNEELADVLISVMGVSHLGVREFLYCFENNITYKLDRTCDRIQKGYYSKKASEPTLKENILNLVIGLFNENLKNKDVLKSLIGNIAILADKEAWKEEEERILKAISQSE